MNISDIGTPAPSEPETPRTYDPETEPEEPLTSVEREKLESVPGQNAGVETDGDWAPETVVTWLSRMASGIEGDPEELALLLSVALAERYPKGEARAPLWAVLDPVRTVLSHLTRELKVVR